MCTCTHRDPASILWSGVRRLLLALPAVVFFSWHLQGPSQVPLSSSTRPSPGARVAPELHRTRAADCWLDCPRRLPRVIFQAACGAHDNWDPCRVRAKERRAAVLVRPFRSYPTG